MPWTVQVDDKATDLQPGRWQSFKESMSPVRETVSAIRRSGAATVGLILVVILIALAALAPVIAPYDPVSTNLHARAQPPSFEYWLGTDHLGRDILSRLVHGARLSLFLGLGSVIIGGVSGVAVGLAMGYRGGWLDSLIMRVVDVLLAFRLLLLAITIMAILGPSLTNVMIAIGLSLFASFARITRGEVLSAKRRDYVEATVSIGGTSSRIMFVHILPNIMGPLIVFATLRLGVAILSESALSFLGLGPSPPTPAWGLMVSEGLSQLRTAWWASTIPGVAITVVVLAFNLLGDGFRDALDPRLRRQR
jgi:peptide/nickel transport system permease protein